MLAQIWAVEDRFRGLFDAVPDAIVLVDAGGMIMLCNSEAECLLGYTRSELCGQLVEVLVPERYRAAHPDHRTAYVAAPRRRPMGAGRELHVRRRDGTEFKAEISLGHVQVGDGMFTVASIRDVTERRRIEAKFRGLLEAAPDATVIVDRSGTIVIVNAQAERMFGYHRSEMIGRPVEMLVSVPHRGRHPQHREAYFGNPHAREMGSGFELAALRKDGTVFPVEISLSPLSVDDEGVLVTSTIRDVTMRKQIENAIAIANKELEAFSYSIAHDLRAPLRGMHGFAQLLAECAGDKLDAQALDCIDEIRRNALHMNALIDGLLSLSNVVRAELVREPVDLGAVARSIGAQCANAAPGRVVGLRLAADLSASGDPRLLRALIANLLENAWKFTANVVDAQVELGVLDLPEQRVYFVRDNGVGFDMSHVKRLFAPFQRLHATSEYPGTGIGLATAQRIVVRHGGRIWAEASPGLGATFFFTLEPENP